MKSVYCSVLAITVAVAASEVAAIPCPSSGAKVKVVINNPTATTGFDVVISGHQVSGKATCAGRSDVYSKTVTISSTGDNEFTVPAGLGLNSGVWVHRIAAGDQSQHQKGVVLYASSSSDYTTVRWTYYPYEGGDGTATTCPPDCTLREALDEASTAAATSSAVLVQFAVSPGIMTSSSPLDVGGGGASDSPIAVDGTSVAGEPWIVGDPLAAAQGNQGGFSRSIDLDGVTRIRVLNDGVVIRGLDIQNTIASGVPGNHALISSDSDDTFIEAVRIDGGARGDCTNCQDLGADLISVDGADAEVVNIEGKAAYSNGVRIAPGSGDRVLRDSWLHHNYARGAFVNGGSVMRNTIELSGRRLFTDAVKYSSARGIQGDAANDVNTSRNVVQNNTGVGVELIATNVVPILEDDYYCGNGGSGLLINGSSGTNATVSGTGLTASYNDGNGITASASFLSLDYEFNDDSAFTSNSSCGASMSSSVSDLNLENNQWRGITGGDCTTSSDVCTPGTIDCSPFQDAEDVSIGLDTIPTAPSLAVLKGQTVRVQGLGFNAIAGNPLATTADCDIGDNVLGATNCCKDRAKANVCDDPTTPGDQPLAPSDHSNCVAFKNGNDEWSKAPVSTVTPTTIVSEIPTTLFNCIGESGERVRVVKLNALGVEVADDEDFCVNP